MSAARPGSPNYQRELAQARARKERYRGACEECDAPTTGCFGHSKAPSLCHTCSNAAKGVAKRGSGTTTSALLGFLDDGERRWIEIRDHLGITNGHTANILNRLLRYGLIVRVGHGRYRRNPA